MKKINTECQEADTQTSATNMDFMPNLSMNVCAMSLVGDLEAIAMSTPLSFNAFKMPLACGYIDGVSRFARHSLTNKIKIKTKFVLARYLIDKVVDWRT